MRQTLVLPFLGSALLGVALAVSPVLVVARDLPQAIAPDKSATLTVADFLRGMEALKKIGPVRAEQDPDYVSALRGLTRIGESYRVDYERAKNAGTMLDSCPRRRRQDDHRHAGSLSTASAARAALDVDGQRIPPSHPRAVSMPRER